MLKNNCNKNAIKGFLSSKVECCCEICLSVDVEQNISHYFFFLIVERIVGVGSHLKTIHIDQNIKRKAAGCHTKPRLDFC